MTQQDGTQASNLQYPTTSDPEVWQVYWKTQGQPWRTEPEIDAERQRYLAERRAIVPDIEKGIYSFRDVKLERADVEWLLAAHESRHGSIDWNNEADQKREGLDLRGADLRQADLHGLPLTHFLGGLHTSSWVKITLEQRKMAAVHLERANLREAHLEKACLRGGHLEGADFEKAHLEGADCYRAHFEGASLSHAYLGGASLQKAYFDAATNLSHVLLEDKSFGITGMADIHWNDVNLAVVNWKQLPVLGEEYMATQPTWWDGQKKLTKNDWLSGYRRAVRGNRQLAVVLRNQGLNEEGARFAYRAQMLQRTVLRQQGEFGQYLFSLFLDLLSGYGHKPGRSFIVYAFVIGIFATIYYVLGTHLAWNEAIVISMTAFHGRGFFPDQFHPGDPQALVAAIEAFVGLLIEVTFIATLTQRLFGK